MRDGVFVGIDHGGSTTTSLVFEPGKGKLSSQSEKLPKSTPGPGLVEHDPDDFVRTSLASASKALEQAGLSWTDVGGIGIANQGETSMAWCADSGRAAGPALSWEDRRTQDICAALARRGVGDLVRARTGVVLDPYFSASKFKWLRENLRDARQAAQAGTLRLGGTDSYLIHCLTGGAVHATEPGTASRTALFNLHDLAWDDDLLAAFDLSKAELPRVIPSAADFGTATHEALGGAKVAITANIVDAHGALFAQGCFDNSRIKATFGTGAFIEINTGPRMIAPDGKLPTFIAWELDGTTDFTVEGGVFAVGSAIDWAVDMGWLSSAAGSSDLALSVRDSGGVSMVPCLTGLSAPHWLSTARGTVNGLGLDTRPGHVARALLDGIAFQCADIIHALDARTGHRVREVCADGGPSGNAYLMQRQADLLGMPVAVSLEPDMTALGAACLAAIGAGAMQAGDMAGSDIARRHFEPAISEDERAGLWANWRRQIAAVTELSSTPAPEG